MDAEQPSISPHAARNRVLIVEDDESVSTVLKRSLEVAGFDAVAVGDGAEGLRVFERDQTMGLVLLDLMMPNVDGYAFRRAQRQDARLASTPVVILTGATAVDVIPDALQAAAYLKKPVRRNGTRSTCT